LDSIAQSAGRCNREGKLNELGNVFVFIPPNPAPPGLLRKGEDAAKEILLSDLPGSLSPETFKRYFEIFFRSAISFDKSGFSKDMCSEAENFIFQFRSQSYKFRLIDDQMQKSIIIWYRGKRSAVSSTEYIEDLRRFGPNRFLLRKLQRFTVNVPARLHENIARQGMIEDISGLYVQRSPGLYREGLGLLPHPEQWSEEFLCF
jgi:CRISPR-associated endonuclease/helicase Cas3